MQFVSGLISRRSCLKPQERFEEALIPDLNLGFSEAGSDITDSMHTDPQTPPFQQKSQSPYCVCLGQNVEGDIYHLPKARWNWIQISWIMMYLHTGPNLHLLIFQMPRTAVTTFCDHPNVLRKDNQYECHGERSEIRIADLAYRGTFTLRAVVPNKLPGPSLQLALSSALRIKQQQC